MQGSLTAAPGSLDPFVPLMLRIGFAMCFVGHGVFGLLQKRDWLPFFSRFGIGDGWALALMPAVGTVDIAIGLAALVLPLRILFLYGAVWCLFTAALRPLTGLSAGEFVERAGNYGIPMAMLVLTAGQRWLARVQTIDVHEPQYARAATACLWTTAALLIGHGWLALGAKPLLQQHLGLIGVSSWLGVVGLIEITLAAVCILRPSRELLLGIAAWKLATESLFIASGAPIREVVERGGSYVAPLVAAVLLRGGTVVRPGRVAALTAAAGILVIVAARPAFTQTNPALALALLDQLRQGGLIVACRHAITSHAREDQMPPNFDDPSTQRVLSPEGEQQARALGQDLAALNIRFAVVLASPFDRTKRSAELMTGRAEIDQALSSMSRGRDAELRALMSGPVEPGSNRLLVTHQGLLYRSFASLRQGSVAEGDCVVAAPREGGADVLAVVKPAEWTRAK